MSKPDERKRVLGAGVLRAYYRADETPPEGEAEPAADGPIRFIASTEGVKRDGLSLKAEDWSLDNYRRNPVIGWAHDYSRLPIGRGEVAVEGDALVVDVTFDRADPFAAEVERKVRTGFVNAVSVGWVDVEGEGGTQHDLLEVSVVPVPADPEALAEGRAWLESLTDERTGAVLSRRNREDLEEAKRLIDRVLKNADHADEKEEPEPEDKGEGRGLLDALNTLRDRLVTLQGGLR